MIQARFRSDYSGEFVILESKWSGGTKHQKREWVANPIENHHISGRAAVIGSKIDIEYFDYKKLENHRGGLLGSKRLQTYGSGDLWTDMKFDFIAITDQTQLVEVKEQKYSEDNIVYTTARNCIRNPENFYLVPYNPSISQISLPIYLAAFDGHTDIFLLGYNNETPYIDLSWKEQINSIIKSYSQTNFILVGIESNMPTFWRENQNVKCMTYREFISYCDV